MIPKKIWSLWLNFDTKEGLDPDKTENKLYGFLKFFEDNIRAMHAQGNWEVTIITNWKKLVDLLNQDEDGKSVLELLENKFIEAAHKSDLIRIYLLKTYGGFWVDFTTLLTCSFDYIVDKNISFGCFYIPSSILIPWIYKPVENFYEYSSVHDFITIENKHIYLKNKYWGFNFITENYFICCTKNHPIISNLFYQLRYFFNYMNDEFKKKIENDKYMEELIKNETLSNENKTKIKNEIFCPLLNAEIHKLFSEIFIINTFDNDIINTIDEKTNICVLKRQPSTIQDLSQPRKDLREQILKTIYGCGYLFGYLQLYLAVFNYCNDKNKIVQINRESIEFVSEKFKEMCINDSCDDIVLKLNNKENEKILLISATRMRTGKWSDVRSNRISWENTFLGEMIYDFEKKYKNGLSTDKDIDEFIKFCNDNKITQFKFSSYSRNSQVISPLRHMFETRNKKILEEYKSETNLFKNKYLKYKNKYKDLKLTLKNQK